MSWPVLAKTTEGYDQQPHSWMTSGIDWSDGMLSAQVNYGLLNVTLLPFHLSMTLLCPALTLPVHTYID